MPLQNFYFDSPWKLIVYFDRTRPICSREIAHCQRQPGANVCEWVDASASVEPLLGPDLTRGSALARFDVRRVDGSLLDGIRRFAEVWAILQRTVWLGRIAGFGPMSALLDAAYSISLRMGRLWRPAT